MTCYLYLALVPLPQDKRGKEWGTRVTCIHWLQTSSTGANLKGAQFDNSQMNGAILRLASLKGASLKSCNLRYSVMAGTDLEVSASKKKSRGCKEGGVGRGEGGKGDKETPS